MLLFMAEVVMSSDMNSGVRGKTGGEGSARSLSTMNLITLSWLLASGQASVLPNADVTRCLDSAVQRAGEVHHTLR